MSTESVKYDPPAGCLLRIFWMVIGNSLLFICAVYVLHNQIRFISIVDLVYWMTILAMLAARYVDIRRFGGTTATGESATPAHWRRYAVWLLVGALIVWISIHLLALAGIMSSKAN